MSSSQHLLYDESARAQAQTLLNKRIAKLSMANIGLLVVWYLMWADFRIPFTSNGVPDFDVAYQLLLLALLGLTLGLWALLVRAFWQRLRMENHDGKQPSKETNT
jgi:hypothetical protein